MNNTKLFKKNNEFIRVLQQKANKYLVISYLKRTMPYLLDSLDGYTESNDEEMLSTMSLTPLKEEDITSSDKRIIDERYYSISAILPFLDNETERTRIIDGLSKSLGISKQTIRSRLITYLIFQTKESLLGKRYFINSKKDSDIDAFKYGLNKYFYNSSKLSLHTSYVKMLNDKYTVDGVLVSEYPSFAKYKRYYYKTRKLSNVIISRNTKSSYYRDYAPKVGGKSSDYYVNLSNCELDGTIADIYVRDNATGEVIRPVLMLAVCPVSKLILGFSVTKEHNSSAVVNLLLNIIEKNETKPVFGFPRHLICDNGGEFKSDRVQGITDLGVTFHYLEPFSPTYKSSVERYIGLVQETFKKSLINRGVVDVSINERNAPCYKKQKLITLEEFKKVIYLSVEYINKKRIVDVPSRYVGKCNPFAYDLFSYLLKENDNTFIDVETEKFRIFLLPKIRGVFRRDGLIVNSLAYRAKNATNDYLKGGSVAVSYDCESISKVYVIKDGEIVTYSLIDNYFKDKTLDDVEAIKEIKKTNEALFQKEELQGQIDLDNQINNLLNGGKKI